MLIPKFGYMGAAWATLITYALMMVVSYITGQKNYPIPYNVSGSLMYVALALLIYFAAMGIEKLFSLQGIVLGIVNTILLLLFAAIVYTLNKNSFKKQPVVVETKNTYRKNEN